MKRTQIYLDEEQDRDLAERAARQGRTKSQLIREALNQYLGAAEPTTKQERLDQFRAAVRAVAGVAPYLPPGDEYVREMRAVSTARQRELEKRWRG